MIKIFVLIASIFISVFHISPCYAEKIYCKDSKVVQGKITAAKDGSVWIEQKTSSGAGAVGISFKNIDKIENEDGSISQYDYNTLYKKIYALVKNKDYKNAIEFSGILLASFPDSMDIHHLRGLLNHKIGNYNEAIKDYDFMVEHGAADSQVFNNLGVTYAALGKYNQAITYFKTAIKQNPAMIGALNNLGMIYMKNEDYASAKEQWEKILVIKPDDMNARQNLEHIKSITKTN